MDVRRIFHVLCTLVFAMNAQGWSQTPWSPPAKESGEAAAGAGFPIPTPSEGPIRLPPTQTAPEASERDDAEQPGPLQSRLDAFELPADATELELLSPIADLAAPREELSRESDRPAISNAFVLSAETENSVRRIPSFVASSTPSNRIVRYEVPLDDESLNQPFMERGIEGQLIEVIDKSGKTKVSLAGRLRTFMSPTESHQRAKKIRAVRYEVPADDIHFHAQLSELDGQILEPGMLRLPEVRFFQPKARVFMDLKQSNDGEFDLFNDGAILASLDVIELYFPMPLISERFAEVFGKPGRLSPLGWRVGGTLGLGITTALNNGTSDNGGAPVSTLSSGIRYEFPLGRPSRELVETGDSRLDQRTRVGMEFGLQGGISTRESLLDSTDVGLYFGVLVNTPWGG